MRVSRSIGVCVAGMLVVVVGCGRPPDGASGPLATGFEPVPTEANSTTAPGDPVAESTAPSAESTSRCPPTPDLPVALDDGPLVDSAETLAAYAETRDLVIVGRIVTERATQEFSYPDEPTIAPDVPAEVFHLRPVDVEVIEVLVGPDDVGVGTVITVSIPDNVETGDSCIDGPLTPGSTEVLFMFESELSEANGISDVDYAVTARAGVTDGVVNAYVPSWIETATHLGAFDGWSADAFVDVLRASQAGGG